jgi:aspartyl-tRNA(Asn)/glutamyl-tRNA(Gln) amidotransferase subunit A
MSTGANTEGKSSPADLGVLEAAEQLRDGQLSAVELTEACLQRIEERNGGAPSYDGAPEAINAWVRLYPDLAREQARAADERRARDGADAPLLCGIPLAVKDLYGIAGLPLTASSRVLDGNVADRDAVAYKRLRDQDMVVLGHTHTHEFGAGGTTDQVGNPFALDRVAGGSSGGSAAALAARMTPAALGSDTCGSLRIPSACCGISAIKPTHGRIPLDGVIPLASSLDHPGPMARSIADCAALLQAMAAGGAESLPVMPPPAPLPELPLTRRPGPRPFEGMTIALTDRPDNTPMEPRVAICLEEATRACERLGARVIEHAAPWAFEWDDLSTILLTEVWAYHRRHSQLHDLYRPAIAEFVEAARNFTKAPPYFEAQQRRAEGTAAWEQWFRDNRVDLVLEPTLPIVPYERGPGYDRGHAGGPGDPMIALTALWDMTGMPVVSLPVSWEIGVSLIAPGGHEAPLVQAAIDLQESRLGVPAWP